MVLALGLDDERVWISRVTRAPILPPWAVPPIVNGLLWARIFNAQYGYLNRTLSAIGAIDDSVNWLGTPGLAMAAVIAAYVLAHDTVQISCCVTRRFRAFPASCTTWPTWMGPRPS